MSPEGLSHAIEAYIASLQKEIAVARAFYFGRRREGEVALASLDEGVRLQIDRCLWEMSGGKVASVAELIQAGASQGRVIAGAILRSVEERMGMWGE
jgi:hypothetical protein